MTNQSNGNIQFDHHGRRPVECCCRTTNAQIASIEEFNLNSTTNRLPSNNNDPRFIYINPSFYEHPELLNIPIDNGHHNYYRQQSQI